MYSFNGDPNGTRINKMLMCSRPTRQIKKEHTFVYSFNGDPNGTRTHVIGVRGQRPRPLDYGAISNAYIV